MRTPLLATLLVGMSALACGQAPETIDPHPAIEVSACARPEAADACVVQFGEQTPGETAFARVDISNISSAADLRVDVFVTHNTEQAFELRPELYDLEIQPGGTALLNIAFTAGQEGTYTGKATVYSDAAEPRPGPIEILLVGYGVAP